MIHLNCIKMHRVKNINLYYCSTIIALYFNKYHTMGHICRNIDNYLHGVDCRAKHLHQNPSSSSESRLIIHSTSSVWKSFYPLCHLSHKLRSLIWKKLAKRSKIDWNSVVDHAYRERVITCTAVLFQWVEAVSRLRRNILWLTEVETRHVISRWKA